MKPQPHSFRTPRTLALAFLLVLVAVLLTACDTPIASDLSEDEAQEALVVLQRYGVAASKQRVGEGKEATWSLMVPETQATQANQILDRYELPRKKPDGLAEVFSASGLIPTAVEEKAKYLMALQGELAHTLEIVDGVVSARVHIVLPERDPLSETGGEAATAGVFIKYRGDHEPLTNEEIKQIVSHAVDGLESVQVAVVMKKIQIDEKELGQLESSRGTFLTAERARIIVPVLGLICILLAVLLGFMMRSLQKQRQRNLQLRREMSVLSAGAGK